MKSKLFVFLVFLMLTTPAFADYVDTAWVRTYDGPASSYDDAAAIAVDNSGYVYVTGYCLGSVTSYDYATIKYFPNGHPAWVSTYNGTGNLYDFARAIAVDGSGNVYVTGVSVGSVTGYDYATIKYNPSGDTAWVRRYSEPTNNYDEATALAVDVSGNVYVTGYSYSPLSGGYDYLTIKYQPNGDTAWIRRYNGSGGGNDEANALALDGSGNVYVTGRSYGGGVTGVDYATIKYKSAGDTVWVRRYDSGSSADRASVMATDASGNTYVTGLCHRGDMFEDITTIKYLSNGDTAWIRRYTAAIDTGDYPRAIIVNGAGDVYVAGRYFDMVTNYDYLVIKYLANGDTAWIRKYNAPTNGYDRVSDMDIDDSGNIYLTGESEGEGANGDYATVKYDPTGRQVWAARFNGPSNSWDYPRAIAVDDSNHVFVTGTSFFSESYDYVTIKYFQYDSIPFAPAVNYGAGNGSLSVFCADLDGDGDLDLAVANCGGNVYILKNNGDGTYQSAVNYTAGDCPYSVFCADMDGDGHLDLTVANNNSNNVSILKNNGDGTFQSAVNYGAGSHPASVFCADLDRDGDLDLAVANEDNANVSILKNNGDGTFQSAINYGVGTGPVSVFCADLDGDGHLDLAVANYNDDNISILKNNGDGTFQNPVNYVAVNRPLSVFCADLDGDGDLDLAVANRGPYPDYPGSVSILKNNGDGTFQPKVDYGTGNYTRSVFCADLDGDGDLDLAAANENNANVSILKNNGDGTFQSAINYGVGTSPVSVFCADLDGDGDFDLAVSSGSDKASILRNLTQVLANQPPWAFSLISPADGDTIFGSSMFRWQTPYDPNFGDQIRYDLYISTSPGFEPPYTIINGDLPFSMFTAVLDSGYYYWKVSAHDNWGAERWSTQTRSFTVTYLTDTLRVIAFSPVDLIVTDPIGDSISLWFNTIPSAFYDTTTDYDLDGDKDDIVTIPNRLVGDYQIDVMAEPGGSGVYNLGIRIDGGVPAMLTMQGGVPCPGPGEVDTFNYTAPQFKSGDANRDWIVDVGDVVYLINYLYKNGSVPEPLGAGDATCDGFVDVGDVVYLINYLFKGGPPPSC